MTSGTFENNAIITFILPPIFKNPKSQFSNPNESFNFKSIQIIIFLIYYFPDSLGFGFWDFVITFYFPLSTTNPAKATKALALLPNRLRALTANCDSK